MKTTTDEEFRFGECKTCGKFAALKDGICSNCSKKVDVPEFFNDLFNGFGKESR